MKLLAAKIATLYWVLQTTSTNKQTKLWLAGCSGQSDRINIAPIFIQRHSTVILNIQVNMPEYGWTERTIQNEQTNKLHSVLRASPCHITNRQCPWLPSVYSQSMARLTVTPMFILTHFAVILNIQASMHKEKWTGQTNPTSTNQQRNKLHFC